jgi:hypothetical protein
MALLFHRSDMRRAYVFFTLVILRNPPSPVDTSTVTWITRIPSSTSTERTCRLLNATLPPGEVEKLRDALVQYPVCDP